MLIISIKKIKCNENQYTNKCLYCQKTFKTKENVSRHIKNNCLVYRNIQEEKEVIFNKLVNLENKNMELNNKNIQLENKLKQIGGNIDQPTNTTNNGIINNTTNIINSNNTNNAIINNITLVAFGNENMDSICKDDILKAVSRGYYATEYLTKTVHFNDKYPEYHNVYIPSMKESYAMIFDGEKWKLTKKKDIIDDIYIDKKLFIDSNLDEFAKSLSPYKMNSLNKWLDSDSNIDDKVDINKIKSIKKNLEILLFNERNRPILLRKRLDNDKLIK